MPRTAPPRAPALATACALLALAVAAAPAGAAGGFTAPADVGPGGSPSLGFGVPATGPSGEIAVLAVQTQAHARASTVVLRARAPTAAWARRSCCRGAPSAPASPP